MPFFGRKRPTPPPAPAEPPRTLPDPPEPGPDGLRALAEHRAFLLSFVEPLPPFGMQLLDAVGLPLCEDLSADQDVPAVPVARVEGYAVLAADLAAASAQAPVRLACVAELNTGDQAIEPMPAGSCVRMVAGAPMPEGSDAVVPLAAARPDGEDGDDVSFVGPVLPGDDVRGAGADIATGDTLLREGERMAARTVGMLAGAGIDRVMARPRPRVVVVASGPELVEPGYPLTHVSDCYDATSYLLAAAARADGATVFRVGAYSNDPAKLKETIADQFIRADLVITTGGLSGRGYDMIRSVVPELGASDFCEVALEPGGQQGFAVAAPDDVPIVMLPGDPLSAYAGYHAFASPIIRTLMGRPALPHAERAVTTSVVRTAAGKTSLVTAIVSEEGGGRRMAQPLGGERGHHLGDLNRANAFIVVGPETGDLPAGSPVPVWLFDQAE